jgi:23S rRNA (uracil1939-C5)-methyltransferase
MSFETVAEKLVYGGEAIAHHEGKTLFVPLALPGERVEIEPVRSAKGVTHARLLRVIEPSSDRIQPPCTYFGNCGGCHYQQLDARVQLEAKVGILRETLRRVGKIAWEGAVRAHAANSWHYRNQAQFKIAPGLDGGTSLGFFEAQSHKLVAVDACLIVSPHLNLTFSALRTPPWPERLQTFRELELLADQDDREVMVTLRGAPFPDAAADEALAQDLLKLPGVRTVAIDRLNRISVWGAPWLTYVVGGAGYRVSPGSFFQVSRFLLEPLVTAVTAGPAAAEQAAKERKKLALDLYAGVGLFTVPLAREFEQVIAVESHPGAAVDLAANAAPLRNVKTASGSTYDFLRRFAQPEPDLVVLDPPRAGVDYPTLERLTKLRPNRIHYLSCHPPTLARDLAYLVQHGLVVESIELFDLFPHTYHIEGLVRLSRD